MAKVHPPIPIKAVQGARSRSRHRTAHHLVSADSIARSWCSTENSPMPPLQNKEQSKATPIDWKTHGRYHAALSQIIFKGVEPYLGDRHRAFFLAIVLPTTFVTLPPLIYPHWLCFVLPCGAWVLVCAAVLCVSSFVMRAEELKEAAGSVPVAAGAVLDAQQRTSLSILPAVATSSSELNVVDLGKLREALQSEPAERVLHRLYTTSELLRRVRVDACTFAIISYRQVRSKDDDFTLGVDAFVAAVRTASESARVDALWVDAWCYRQEGEYDHMAFCNELSSVMRHVSAIIWLPRSRIDAPPSYQFRLWCSFEASVCEQRRLPVFVAGQGLSLSQHALRRFGNFLPALPGWKPPQEVRVLATINGVLCMVSLFAPFFIPFFLVSIKKGGIWAQLVPRYGLEAAYARNGQRVLRAMHEGMRRGVALNKQRAMQGLGAAGEAAAAAVRAGVANTPDKEMGEHLAQVAEMLPWLPAHDRRDAMVVRVLLRELMEASAEGASSLDDEEAIRALAVSCFAAAIMEPSYGDRVGSLDIDAWLAQKEIALAMDKPICLAALAKFGWSVVRGSPNVLTNPAGRIRVLTPPIVTRSGASRWDASEIECVEEAPVAVQVAPLLGCMSLGGLLFLAFFATSPIDVAMGSMTNTSHPHHGYDHRHVLHYASVALVVIGPLFVLSLYVFLFSFAVMPWLYTYPHPAHLISYGAMFGAVGYHAHKEFVVLLLVAYSLILPAAFLLFLSETAFFQEPSDLFVSAYTSELAHAARRGIWAAPELISLAFMHGVGMVHSSLAAHATWHMWQCGRHSGARYMLTSPDSKSATFVSFTRPRAMDTNNGTP